MGERKIGQREVEEGMSTLKVVALRSVPVLGWIGLFAGLPYALGKKQWPNPTTRMMWWTDLTLSVGVHALQVPVALRERHTTGHTRARTAIMTFIFGLTWWKTITPAVVTRAEENQ